MKVWPRQGIQALPSHSRHRVRVAGMLLATALFIAACLMFLETPCTQWLGGKWASSTHSCVTRACYYTRSCGHWAGPADRCGQLQAGDSRAEVYFQLGMPYGDDGRTASWAHGKAEGGKIEAYFVNDRLQGLQCGALHLP